MPSMDPLSALRDFTIRGELDKIVRVGEEFRFADDYTFPCTAETAYRSKQGNLYTLETLLNFIKNHHLKHVEYIQNSRTLKIPSVTLPDRKPLLDYLSGNISSHDAIEFIPSVHPIPHPDVEEYRPDDPNLLDFPQAPTKVDESDDPPNLNPDRPLDYVSMIRAVERPLKDRESLLECRHRDFHSLLLASTRREEERQRKDSGIATAKGRDDRWKDGDAGLGAGFDSTPKPKMHHLLKGSKVGEGVPIILVPSAFQTLITIYNVKEFLEDGVFVPTDAKVKAGAVKPDCVTVQKKFSRDRVVAAYEVRDKPSALKPEDWDRVVAVFVLGKEWQFKDWPFKDHVEIFNKIIGFYMRFEDDSVESAKTAKQWNVKIISISKNRRHQDRAAALEVWDRLEEFMRSRSHN